MSLQPDQQLGPYRIISTLGSGGMGEVFRARDGKLDRDVAVKVLPARLAAEPEALARFEREAKAVAALSHPNILAIHDFGEADGRHYAVMELLEGESLRETIERGPLPPKRAIDYARQVADGLAAAHDKGIVHRDLKPENLFIARDGRVKILDFGLAKQTLPFASTSDPTSPTVARGTEPGTVMGTAGYMAPEQVRGDAVDHRTDLFALGAVLYEMLAGQRAFDRPTGAETMAAILNDDPLAITSVRPELPPGVERVIDHCLEKRPEGRFQSARDLAFGLGGATTSSGQVVPSSGSATARRGSVRPTLVVAALLVGIVIGLLARSFVAGPVPPQSALEVRYLTYSGKDFSPATSPDGKAVAFRSDRDGHARIWLKQLATGTEVALTEGPLDDLPQFSPDGSVVMFTRSTQARQSLYRVPLLGGEPRRVVEDAVDGAWSPDGKRIAFIRLRPASPGKAASSSLMVAASDGAEPRELLEVDAATAVAPRWSPDGRQLAFNTIGVGAGTFVLRVVDVDSGAAETIAAATSSGRPWAQIWTDSGQLLYTSGQIGAGTLAGTAGRLIERDMTSQRESVLYASPSSLAGVALVGTNGVVLESQTFQQNVTEWAAGGTQLVRSFSQGRSANRQPVYSPDGKRIVFSSDRAGNLDLWEAFVETGELRQLTDDSADDWDPVFGHDGLLYWSSNRSGSFEIWMAEGDGSAARQLTRDGVDAENPDVSSDGRWVVYASTRPGEAGIWRIRSDGTDASLLVSGQLGIPEISPDDRHVCYLGFGGGTVGTEIQCARLEDGEIVAAEIEVRLIRPTTANLGRARWMPDGRLAFVAQDEQGVNGIFVQDFAPGQNTSATRRKLAGFDPEIDAETFGVSPDGKRIAIAGRKMTSSLVLLEGVDGLR